MTDDQLIETPDVDLSAGLYYRKFKLMQKREGSTGVRKNMVESSALYEIYFYYSDQKGKPLTPNMFVKAVRAEGTKLSNERSRTLVEETFRDKYTEEKQDG